MEIDEKNIFFKPVNIKNMFSLQHKHAAITGAGSGIGKAVALLLARQGATVHVIDVNETQAAEVVKEIEGAGGKASAPGADVSNQQRRLALLAALPQIDILVNSAGAAHLGSAETTGGGDLDLLYNVSG